MYQRYITAHSVEKTIRSNHTQSLRNEPIKNAGIEAKITGKKIRVDDKAKSGGKQQHNQKFTCVHGAHDRQLQTQPKAERQANDQTAGRRVYWTDCLGNIEWLKYGGRSKEQNETKDRG